MGRKVLIQARLMNVRGGSKCGVAHHRGLPVVEYATGNKC